MGSEQRMTGSQQAVALESVTILAIEPYLLRMSVWFAIVGALVYAKTNVFFPFISVKAYTLTMGRDTKSFDLVRLFAALADPTRLRLLNLMARREDCVGYFLGILK